MRKKGVFLCTLVFSIFLLVACDNDADVTTEETTATTQAPTTTEQVSPAVKDVDYSEEADLHYVVTLPRGYEDNPEEKRPLILFLHGAGERGDNIDTIRNIGIPLIYRRFLDFPFVTISPQCPDGTLWNALVDSLDVLLDEVIEKYNIDEDRVYMTGLSLGGFGTWEMAMRYPERFAAIAPVAGAGNPAMVSNIKEIPVWAFHGEHDEVVPKFMMDLTVNALKAAGGNVKYTVYPNTRHDSWTRTYNDRALYEWLLEHERDGSVKPIIDHPLVPKIVEKEEARVAYYRVTGPNSWDVALSVMKAFVSENELDKENQVTYYAYELGEVQLLSEGTEMWVVVPEGVEETDLVKIKTVPFGTFAEAEASTLLDPFGFNVTLKWVEMLRWLRSSDAYIHDASREELIQFNDGSNKRTLLLPVKPKDTSDN